MVTNTATVAHDAYTVDYSKKGTYNNYHKIK